MDTKALTTAAVAVLLLTGCAGTQTTEPAGGEAPASAGESSTPTPSTTEKQTPAAASGTRQDPVQLGKTFLEAAYRWDTRTGTDLTAALQRVEYMTTDQLAGQFIEPKNSSVGATWNKAEHRQAHTEPKVTVVPDANQALVTSKPGTEKAGYIVSWDWVGPGGYQQDGGKDLVTLTMTQAEEGWKVASFGPTPLK